MAKGVERGRQLQMSMISWLGTALILLGLLVPSSTWIDLLRTTPSTLREQLLLGGTLFRIGLGLLGLFLLIARGQRWWRPAPAGEIAPAKPAWSRREMLLLAGILIAATALRLYHLNQGLWLDEVSTLVHYAWAPFGEIITTYESQNQHFLYSLLAHTSFLIFGESAWALRLPAVLFGIGSIWALYLLAREVSSTREAVFSAALMAVSYHHVWFSQNARGYTGLLFWTLLASWLFVRGLAEPRPQLWLYYAGAVTLGVYTHMTMVFVAIGQFIIYVWVLVARRRQPWPYRWAALGGFCLAALLTFQLHAITLPQIFGLALADLSPVETWRSPLWTLQEMIRGLHLGFGKGLAALFAITVLGAGVMSYLRRQPMVPLLLVIPVILGSTVVIAIGHPLWPRFFFFALGFGILVVVRGTGVMAELAERLLGWPAGRSVQVAAALLIAMIAGSASSLAFVYGPKQDFVGASDYIKQAGRPGDAVVAVGLAAFPYRSYYAPEWETPATLVELNRIRARSKRTWLLYTLPLQMEAVHPDILDGVQREFHLVRTFDGSLWSGTIFLYRSNDPRGKTRAAASDGLH